MSGVFRKSQLSLFFTYRLLSFSNVMQALDEIWSVQHVKPYPEKRMLHLFEILAATFCRWAVFFLLFFVALFYLSVCFFGELLFLVAFRHLFIVSFP